MVGIVTLKTLNIIEEGDTTLNVDFAKKLHAGGGGASKPKEEENPKVTEVKKVDLPKPIPKYTPTEIEILTNLSKRKKELDSYNDELEKKEKLLNVTEQRIEGKIEELNELKLSLQELIKKYNEQDEEGMQSLVKIYEKMKPKEAAKIFEDLEMEVLLPVIDRMKESRVSPILAQLSAKKAIKITKELADYRKIENVLEKY